jgi:hypothetical protein
MIAAATTAASAAEIPVGMHLLLSLEETISTRSAKIGDAVHLRTLVPIPAERTIAVPIGSDAEGTISRVRRDELQIELSRILLPGGRVLNISSQSTMTPDKGSPPRISFVRLAVGVPVGVLLGSLPGALAGAVLTDSQKGAEIGAGVGAAISLGIMGGVSIKILHEKRLVFRRGTTLDAVFLATVKLPD